MKNIGLSYLLKADNAKQDREHEKIEIIGCPYGGKNCRHHLDVINSSYLESARYQQEKNYLMAIELLKTAYYKTNELQKTTCSKCASLFRSTIASSMTDMHRELHKMSTGIFRNKRYHEVYVKADNALKEITNKI